MNNENDKVKVVKAKKTVKEDDPVFLASQNINNIKVYVEDGFFYIIGEHYGEEIIIRFSLKSLEIIKKQSDGVFTEIGKNIKL